MRKTYFYGITAAMTMLAASPLTALASEGNSLSEQLKQKGYAVVAKEACSAEELKELFAQIEAELGNGNWQNCLPGAGTPESGKPDAPETEAPELPDDGKPDEPEMELPELPDSGTPDVPDAEQPGTPELPDMETPDTDKPETGKPNTPETGNPDGSETDKPEEFTYAEQVVKLVNAERTKRGLKALTIDMKVAAAANVRAEEIKQSFAHTRPNGTNFSTALKEQGVSYRGSGENIAYGQLSPEAVMQGWMNSDGHRANILNASYTHIGVGHFRDANGTNYWTQLFTY